MPRQRFKHTGSTPVSAALASWPQWARVEPKLINKLSGGLTNQLYLVQTAADYCVLRLHNPRSRQLGIQRAHEQIILRALAPLGLSPRLLYWSPAGDFSVFQFIAGRVWTARDWASRSQQAELQRAIQRYQSLGRQLSLSLPPFSYRRHLQAYWRQLNAQNQAQVIRQLGSWELMSRRLACLELQALPRALVHHDLNPANIIETPDQLFILDWEYAGLAYGFMDELALAEPGRRIALQQREVGESLRVWLERLWWGVRKH